MNDNLHADVSALIRWLDANGQPTDPALAGPLERVRSFLNVPMFCVHETQIDGVTCGIFGPYTEAKAATVVVEMAQSDSNVPRRFEYAIFRLM